MTTVTSWQRLNAAFWLLIVLLLASLGLAFWVADARSVIHKRSEQLAAARGNIAYKVVLISEPVGGLLLDPKNVLEKARVAEAEKELASEMRFIQTTFADYPDLMRSVTNLSEFTLRTLADFHRRVLDMADTNSASAVMLYVKDNPEIRNTRGKLFAELASEVERVQNAEAKREDRLGLVGLAPFAILLLAIPIVGRVHSSTVAQIGRAHV